MHFVLCNPPDLVASTGQFSMNTLFIRCGLFDVVVHLQGKPGKFFDIEQKRECVTSFSSCGFRFGRLLNTNYFTNCLTHVD